LESIKNGKGIVEKFGRYFEISTSMLKNKKGRIVGKVVFFHDITELKHSQEVMFFQNER